EEQGKLDEAHRHFQRVTAIDPSDAAAWYWSGSTLAEAGDQIADLTKAVKLNPYLAPALYKLAFAQRLAGQPQKQKELLEQWKKMNPDRLDPVPGPGDPADKIYGE